ncbi:MAG: ATP-binding protein [Myxococcaceae bacterium]
MKIDPAPGHNIQAFFDTLQNLIAANPAFQSLSLGELLKGLVSMFPPDSGPLSFSRGSEIIAVLGNRLLASAADALQAAQSHQRRLEQILLDLGRQVAGATSEEELVAVVARSVKQLFPGRSFCIRIADQRTHGLTSLYAEGRLRDGDRDVLVVKQSALKKIHLDLSRIAPERVKVVEGDVPLLFEGSERGISAPLVASGQLFGMINVEYPTGMVVDPVADDRTLTQLVNQVAVAIRNAKLIDELTFVRKYLEELLEHANALILVVNPQRRIVVFNRALATLTGYRKEEVLGRDLLDFIPESERMRVMRVTSAAMKGEAVSNFETRILATGGREIRVAFATSSLMAAEGEVEGVIAIGQDLTIVRELERRVIHAEKLATLGQLAASVVHEINNPMTAVATYAHAMLARTYGNPNAEPGDQEKLKKILENSDRVLKFTRDLVSYARPAQNKPEWVELHSLLETAIGFCDHVLAQHGVRVERSFSPVPRIAAVKGNLVQVFVNLITNACHAMSAGGAVQLSTGVEAGEVVIRVRDSGVGIAPQDLARIFEPFFTTKPDGKGTGLGLSIVQGIVENHGGEIAVESETGVGTVFTLRLPSAG